jgi:flagellar biosynthesis/type III secretory pathway protein FliH
MGHIIKKWGHGHVVPAAVLDARSAAAEIRRQAHEQGYQEGRARAALEVANVLAAARAQTDAALARARSEALDVAAAMAERIVGRAVQLDPDVMAEIAGEALAACQTRRGGVVLRVHPEHLGAVEGRRAALAARLGEEAALEIVGDDAVEPLGCVVDTAVGRVDARLPALMAALTASLAAPSDEERR